MMKKLVMLLLVIGLSATFAACGGQTTSSVDSSSSSSEQHSSTGPEDSSSEDNKKQNVEVTFKQDGQTDIVKTVRSGEALTDIPTPTQKLGYTVVWDRTDFSSIMENTFVNAVETANTYTITYDANGGEDVPMQTVTFDDEYTLATPTNDFSYMRFDGWKNAEGETIALTGVWTVAKDVGLTAQWTDMRGKHTVTFKQGDEIVGTFDVQEGDNFTEIPNYIEKVGYIIKWNEEDLAKLSNIKENVVVNALETAKTYTIVFDANGGTVSQTSMTVTYGQDYELLLPSHNESAFVKWVYNGEDISMQGIWTLDVEAGEIVIMAIWGLGEWTEHY